MIRTFDPGPVNELANHPAIHPYVSGPVAGELDLTEAVADPRNIVLICEGGCFLMQFVEPGTYEAHSLFRPEARGRTAIEAARQALRLMFTDHGADQVLARCPKGNLPVLAFVRALGFAFLRNDEKAFPSRDGFVDQRWFVMTRERWQEGDTCR